MFLCLHVMISFPFFTDDERAFGYVRLITGDEMSKRSKFALITWIGKNVKPLQKARVSTDKAFVKDVLRVSWNFFKLRFKRLNMEVRSIRSISSLSYFLRHRFLRSRFPSMTSQILLKTKSVKLSSKQVERTTEPETKRPLVSNKFI